MAGNPIAATEKLKELMAKAQGQTEAKPGEGAAPVPPLDGGTVPPGTNAAGDPAAPPPPAGDAALGGGQDAPYTPSERIPFKTHAVFGLCALMVVSFGVWSAISEIDIVSMAMGEVIPSTQVKTIQHLEGGIVREIKVIEGARVKAGQELVELEPTASSADVGELGERLVSLRFDLARLRSLLRGDDKLEIDPELTQERPDLAAAAHQRFQADLEKFQSDMKRQEAAINQRQQEIHEIRTRIANAGKSLKLVDEQVKISEGLLKRDLTNRFV
ncbi:MAG TPA: hypothetical protein DCG48_07360, partial [Rhodospirillaceae bacterium]|nr:hypothetical protein [Rhodospirillaceae bacterium]